MDQNIIANLNKYRCGYICLVVLILALLLVLCSLLSTRNWLSFQDQSQKYFRHTTFSSVKNVSTHGYVVSMRYNGQQGAGIQALMSLQCFVGSFNLQMKILEPAMSNTAFESFLSDKDHSKSSSMFTDIFDISHFNVVSKREGFATISSEKEFLQSAPRNVILANTKLRTLNSMSSPVSYTHLTLPTIYSV